MAIPIKRVLVSDPVDESCVELLKKHGFQVTCKYKLEKEELIKELQSAEALVVRSETKVREDVLNSVSRLRVIGRAGTGVDNIDVAAATRRGVIVLNSPGGNSISACELTCAFITSLARNVASGCQSLKEGRWDRKLYTGSELAGKTLAVLGLGRIGREVALRMKSFGMRIIGFDPIVTREAAAALGIEKLDLPQIWPQADYITVHTPLIPETRNLINEASLKCCRRGVRIVNVARGGIVDEKALLAALKDGRCGGAALDVFSEEPPKSDFLVELIRHPKVLATPHLGASTSEAQQRVAVDIAEQLIALANPGNPSFHVTGVVNAPVLAALREPSNTPWISLGRDLGSFLGRLSPQQDSLASLKLVVQTAGDKVKDMTFLRTAIAAGFLTNRTQNGLNLINAVLLAEEMGLKIDQIHSDHPRAPCVTVTVSGAVQHSVVGTSRGDESWLLSIDDANFTSGVPMGAETLIFRGTNATVDCTHLIGELVKIGAVVTNMAVARGKSAVWISVQTHGAVAPPTNLSGLVAF